ncbi:MAG: hypothetical protein WDA20_10735 [Desulfuromonadales bacterium]
MNVVIEACSATDFIIECTYTSCRHRRRLSINFIDKLRKCFPNQSDGDNNDEFRSFIFKPEIIEKLICSKCGEKQAKIILMPLITPTTHTENSVPFYQDCQIDNEFDNSCQPDPHFSEYSSIVENWRKKAGSELESDYERYHKLVYGHLDDD